VLRQQLPVSGARQHGHPGFPLFLRPPGARSISTRPRSCKAAGPCLLGSMDPAKDDGTPRGAVLLPFPVRDRTPVRSISARVVAQRLPMKVLIVESRKHATPANPLVRH